MKQPHTQRSRNGISSCFFLRGLGYSKVREYASGGAMGRIRRFRAMGNSGYPCPANRMLARTRSAGLDTDATRSPRVRGDDGASPYTRIRRFRAMGNSGYPCPEGCSWGRDPPVWIPTPHEAREKAIRRSGDRRHTRPASARRRRSVALHSDSLENRMLARTRSAGLETDATRGPRVRGVRASTSASGPTVFRSL
jgi:hypothetical protein